MSNNGERYKCLAIRIIRTTTVVQWPHDHLSCLLEQKNGMYELYVYGHGVSMTLYKHGIVTHVTHQLPNQQQYK